MSLHQFEEKFYAVRGFEERRQSVLNSYLQSADKHARQATEGIKLPNDKSTYKLNLEDQVYIEGGDTHFSPKGESSIFQYGKGGAHRKSNLLPKIMSSNKNVIS